MNQVVFDQLPGVDLRPMVARYLDGDSTAGNDLAKWVHQAVRRRLLRRGLSEHECEEIGQECVVSIFSQLAEYDENLGPFEAWVNGFIQNCWRNHIRTLVRTKNQVVPIESAKESYYEAFSEIESRDNLNQAMETLDLIDRELIHLRFGLGMSSDEIALSSSMNAPQVRKRISRAVERLRRHPATQSLLARI